MAGSAESNPSSLPGALGHKDLETELKFQVPADRRAALRRAVATARVERTRLQAVYADTPDHRLAAAGLALRLRKEGRAWVQTLKGRGDGLMQRLEHEVRLPAQAGVPTLDRSRHAGTPAGALLDAALGADGVLAPLYRTDIQRLHRRVRHAGAVIEIAYDVGRIVAGSQSLAVDEIEFELISGPAQALPALAVRWVQRHGLWWDVRTKSERGFRLALGLHQVPAVKAAAVTWPEAADRLSAWQAMLSAALGHALPNAAEIASGSSRPEHLHQLRVALRRLRTALVLFADWSGQREDVLLLEERWAAVFATLGTARDADVLAGTFGPQLLAAGAPPRQQSAPVHADDTRRIVCGSDLNVLLLQTLALAAAEPRLQPAGEVAGPAPDPLPEAAGQVLKKAWRRACADTRQFDTGPDELRHRARKRLKRLRYALEFVAPVLQRKPLHAQLRALGKALDALGRFNDLLVADAHFKQQADPEPAAWFALGWLAAQRGPALGEAMHRLVQLQLAPKAWRRLKKK